MKQLQLVSDDSIGYQGISHCNKADEDAGEAWFFDKGADDNQ